MSTRSRARVTAGFRPEIQALRAIAIAAVVVYHLAPRALPGGFVGVDVFFVISGYLITAHLVRDVARGARTPFAFWARRIRRLMPASLVALAVTACAAMLVVPQQLWQQFLREVIASTLYVQNWFLANASVDYLSASAPPSPVQHFWTLSVEEQFYLVWPLIILAAWWISIRVRAHRAAPKASVATTVLVAAATVWVASFAWAWFSTSTNPSVAFFATTPRGWEFASGALLAAAGARAGREHLSWLAPRWIAGVRLASTWLGWLLIAVSVVAFSAHTFHPGPPTLVPVAGTLLVIAGGFARGTGSPGAVVEWAPVQYLGDISYSLYLWHWPLILLVPYAMGRPMGWATQLAVVGASVALAALSYRWVERPMLDRTPRAFASTRGAMLGLAAAMIVVVAISVAGLAGSVGAATSDQARLDAETASPDPCRGAVAVVDLNGCATQAPIDVLPAVSVAADDVPPISRSAPCLTPPGNAGALGICDLRGGDGLRVGMVGDSHIHHLIPVALTLADKYDWSLTEVHRVSCPFSEAQRDVSPVALRAGCAAWNDSAQQWIEDQQFDLVITSQRQDVAWLAEGDMTARETAVNGLVEAWQSVIATGARVLVVKDNPLPIKDVLPCIELAGDDLAGACTVPEGEALRWDPQVEAAAAFAARDVGGESQVALVDLDDAYCWDGTCHPVAGGALVYRDRDGHMTATWTRSLAPLIVDRVPPGFLTDAGAAPQ